MDGQILKRIGHQKTKNLRRRGPKAQFRQVHQARDAKQTLNERQPISYL